MISDCLLISLNKSVRLAPIISPHRLLCYYICQTIQSGDVFVVAVLWAHRLRASCRSIRTSVYIYLNSDFVYHSCLRTVLESSIIDDHYGTFNALECALAVCLRRSDKLAVSEIIRLHEIVASGYRVESVQDLLSGSTFGHLLPF